MSSDRSAQSTGDYAGCRCIVSSTGLCGVALGVDGEHAGFLYDFFASPYEDVRAVYALMEWALDEGADKLTICASPFLTSFFEQFGFEAVCILDRRGAPPNWIADAWRPAVPPIEGPDFVFMARKIFETSPAVRSWMSRARELPQTSGRLDGRQGPCANCAAPIASENGFDLFAGYQCRRCGFLYACGTLTMGIPRPGALVGV